MFFHMPTIEDTNVRNDQYQFLNTIVYTYNNFIKFEFHTI